jgi:RNA polymerase sigma factor (TIGR02999 family)
LSKSGEKLTAKELLPLVYDELHAVAEKRLRKEKRNHTLRPTEIVNEVYVRLIRAAPGGWNGRTHFFAVAARTVRRVLIDHARRRPPEERISGSRRISIADPAKSERPDPVDLLALDQALKRLAETKPRHARLVELRFFGGLEVEEAAEILGVSKETAKLDWRFARAWLNRELSGRDAAPSPEVQRSIRRAGRTPR